MIDVCRAFGICAIIIMLAGCGGSQSAMSGTMPQAPAAQSRTHQESGSSGDLLYVVTSDQTDILTYPGNGQVGTIKGYLGSATSNPNNGNVLFDNSSDAFEYAHGGTTPIASFIPANGQYLDGAFDPTSNNIALTAIGIKPSDAVAVFQSPSGSPTFYRDSTMPYMDYLCYDDRGNLFVTGSALNGEPNMIAELPKGSSTFTDITFNKKLTDLKDLRWDGTYITVSSGHAIYRLQFSGSSGTIVEKVAPKNFWARDGRYWIQSDTLIAPHTSPQTGTYLGFWNYPHGGRPFDTIKDLSLNHKDRIIDVTVSINPSQ